MYEGTYWDLLANIGELTEALTQMAVGPTVLEEPVLQLPPSPTLPSWDTFKPVLQPLPPLPQVLCCAVLCSAVLRCALLACAGLRCTTQNMLGSTVPCCVALCCAITASFWIQDRTRAAAEVAHASAVTASHTEAGANRFLALATFGSATFTYLSCPHAVQLGT